MDISVNAQYCQNFEGAAVLAQVSEVQKEQLLNDK